ncbi:MAG TPA: NAD(P)-dependent alcohol dehydrogenase [Chloroflexia bacterium]|nr:NAD(P)-dependent alcohol dehydrogenase [Chloroflexia bacterium]
MKAVIWTAYGPPEVLQVQEVEKPTPGDNEVLICIRALTVTAGDVEVRKFTFPYSTPWIFWLIIRLVLGLRRPKRIRILGQDLAGDVEAVGSAVTRWAVGDPVFAGTGFALGAYAEYCCLPETALIARKPPNIPYGEAAAVGLAGVEALRLIRRANLQPGHRILIIGAGGSIGTFAVQLAKHLGAEVTAVDSTAKLDMLRALGADHVVDYTREDCTKRGQTYDAILDVTSTTRPAASKRALRPTGIDVSDSMSWSAISRSLWAGMTKRKQPVQAPRPTRAENLALLTELMAAGKLKTIVDRTYPLEQMAEAHRYVETGQKLGHVVITVGPTSPPSG